MKRQIAAEYLAAPGLRATLSAVLPRTGVLVLNYHRVGDGSDSRYDRALWSASAEAFEEQVRFLKERCDVVSLDEIGDALQRPRGRHVAITFDDGYLDNYQIAFPVLRRHGVPATFFVATGFIDHRPLPWWDAIAMQVRETTRRKLDLREWMRVPLELGEDREHAIWQVLATYKSLPAAQAHRLRERLAEQTGIEPPQVVDDHWMDWDMIRTMAAAGMTIGGHTVNHPVLSSLPVDAQRREIFGCAERLRQELGIAMTHFAYPVGGRSSANADTRRLLREAGVAYAYSFYGGVATVASARLDLQRTAMASHIDRNLFRAMVQLPQVFCRPTSA